MNHEPDLRSKFTDIWKAFAEKESREKKRERLQDDLDKTMRDLVVALNKGKVANGSGD